MKATMATLKRLTKNVDFATYRKSSRNCEACAKTNVGTVEKYGLILCLDCANNPRRIERRVLDLKYRIEQLEQQLRCLGPSITQ